MPVIEGKNFLSSWTFWGAILFGVTVTLEGLNVELGIVWLQPVITGLGSILTILGIRRAL